MNSLITMIRNAILLSLLALPAASVFANDIPTVERVEYVLECMRSKPGAAQEMLYKCSCALDALATEFTHDQFVDGMTAANALSIGGERGSVLRDSEGAKALAGKYRAAVTKAKKGCFLD